jgi:hypothetical protein
LGLTYRENGSSGCKRYHYYSSRFASEPAGGRDTKTCGAREDEMFSIPSQFFRKRELGCRVCLNKFITKQRWLSKIDTFSSGMERDTMKAFRAKVL